MSRLAALLLPLALLPGATASAATFVVDDSRSQVQAGLVRMKWDDVVPGRSGNGMTGRLTVVARLDVSPWRGRVARIYLTLPPQAMNAVAAHWTSRGVLASGSVRPGERTLVYAGPIVSDQLEDTLLLTLQADGTRLVRTESLQFQFEIDVDSP